MRQPRGIEHEATGGPINEIYDHSQTVHQQTSYSSNPNVVYRRIAAQGMYKTQIMSKLEREIIPSSLAMTTLKTDGTIIHKSVDLSHLPCTLGGTISTLPSMPTL